MQEKKIDCSKAPNLHDKNIPLALFTPASIRDNSKCVAPFSSFHSSMRAQSAVPPDRPMATAMCWSMCTNLKKGSWERGASAGCGASPHNMACKSARTLPFLLPILSLSLFSPPPLPPSLSPSPSLSRTPTSEAHARPRTHTQEDIDIRHACSSFCCGDTNSHQQRTAVWQLLRLLQLIMARCCGCCSS